jgi:superfamily II DNA or RNA helicase
MITLRRWQAEFIAKFEQLQPENALGNVVPGGGKSLAAGEVARRFLQRSTNGRLVVIVPTCGLVAQWQRNMTRTFKIELSSEIDGLFRAGYHGVVTTYAALAHHHNAVALARYVSGGPTFAIIDEAHHAGDSAAFGLGLITALANARHRLFLSGTAWRPEGMGDRIPFLEVVEDDYGPTYREFFLYDFTEAVRDKVIRAVTFTSFDARPSWIKKNLTLSTTLSGASLAMEPVALKIALQDEGFLEEVLGAVDARLTEQRRFIPGAKALAIGIDTPHARLIARVLERITGEKPAIIVSDEDTATSTIRQFEADPRARWVSSIRKISEGVDIPSILSLAYLSTVKTSLFFRQAVGRAIRRQGDHDPVADVFIPASPTLMKHAKQIEASCAKAAALNDLEEEEQAPEEPADEMGERMRSSIHVLGVDNIGRGGAINAGHDGTLELGFAPAPVELTLEEKEVQLRGEIQSLVARYARIKKSDPRTIHSLYKRNKCRVPQSKMSWAQLVAKRDHFKKLLGQTALPTTREHANVGQ